MEKAKELIGVLEAISIVAKNLAERLIRVEQEVQAHEAADSVCGVRLCRKGGAKR